MAMNAERFEKLAEAYGGDIRRWPSSVQEAARAFASQNRSLCGRLLFEARLIDAALDSAPAPMVSHALRARIVEAAPEPRPSGRGWPGVAGRGSWAPWAGLAAACAAGAVVGAVVVQNATAGPRADELLASNDASWVDAYAAEAR
jgi:hypothetical protein